MRIAALSEATGLPVATLKYYLREGLLHPGTATARNQAAYDDGHVRRARLVRALLELGNLQLADIKRVLAAVDDDTVPLHDAFGVAQDAMVPPRDRDTSAYARALGDVDVFVRRNRLHVRPDAQVRGMLADALVAMRSGGWDLDLAEFDARMPAIVAQAIAELGSLPPDDRAAQMEASVIGTISYEVAIAALRRLALEHASWRRFGR
ncbi:MerR family transcriptional regulator [Pseudolysinimonas sp.]